MSAKQLSVYIGHSDIRTTYNRFGHLMLCPEALDALVEWLIYSMTNRLPDTSLILEYRREMLSQLGT